VIEGDKLSLRWRPGRGRWYPRVRTGLWKNGRAGQLPRSVSQQRLPFPCDARARARAGARRVPALATRGCGRWTSTRRARTPARTGTDPTIAVTHSRSRRDGVCPG